MGGGAFEHLYRGRSSGDGSGCLWFLLFAVLFLAVILAGIGRKQNKPVLETPVKEQSNDR